MTTTQLLLALLSAAIAGGGLVLAILKWREGRSKLTVNVDHFDFEYPPGLAKWMKAWVRGEQDDPPFEIPRYPLRHLARIRIENLGDRLAEDVAVVVSKAEIISAKLPSGEVESVQGVRLELGSLRHGESIDVMAWWEFRPWDQPVLVYQRQGRARVHTTARVPAWAGWVYYYRFVLLFALVAIASTTWAVVIVQGASERLETRGGTPTGVVGDTSIRSSPPPDSGRDGEGES